VLPLRSGRSLSEIFPTSLEMANSLDSGCVGYSKIQWSTEASTTSQLSTGSSSLTFRFLGRSRSNSILDGPEVSVKVMVMGQAADLIIEKAVSVEPAKENCSLYLSEFSNQPDTDLEEISAGVNLNMAGQSVQVMSYLSHLPACQSRLEALGTTVVYVLHINPSEGQFAVHEQLTHYGYILNELRHQKRKLRPSRALLLMRTAAVEEDPLRKCLADWNDAAWQSELYDFELAHTGLSKFGPISVDDAAGIRETFESIALSRNTRRQVSNGSDSEGSHVSEPPPAYEAEREDSDFVPATLDDEPAITRMRL